MNFLSQVVLLGTLFGATFSEETDEYMFIKVEYEMPIKEVLIPEGDKPDHGTCYNNSKFCLKFV